MLQRNSPVSGSYSFDDPDRPRWDHDTRFEKKYDYHREDGTYSYSVLKGRRSDGTKTFARGRRVCGTNDHLQAQQDGELFRLPGLETYRKGTGDEPDLLYRLPGFVAATAAQPDAPVFAAEGEKDADSLWDEGLIATTNANGALNYNPAFNGFFAGRTVAIMVDNDDKGRKRAAALIEQLAPVAKAVKPVELEGLPPHGDVTDWLSSGKTKADLLKVVAETPPVTSAAEWENARRDFARDEDGRPYRTQDNAKIALASMGASVRYDEFAGRYLVGGLDGFGPVLDDAALTRLRLSTEAQFNLTYGKERWADIVTDYARHNSVHPVRAFLNSSQWDGATRLDRWLVAYAGAEDTEYVRAVGAICLVAAVRRVRQPGCKFDEMLVLESEQGTGKSTALSILAVNEDWFADDVPLDADSKVIMERTAGRWIIELGELKGMRRGAVEHVKGMLSRRVDKARLAYGRLPTEQPRQCIFIGTTNDSEYLRDMTGNRRFWPVKVRRFDLKALRGDRDQLWAEAAAREAVGDSIRLPEHLWAAAEEQQAGREIGDPLFEILHERLDGHEGKIRASDVWEAVGLGDPKFRTQDHNVRLSAVMQKLGWRRPKSKLRFDGRPQHAWVKGQDGQKVDAYPEVPRGVVLGQEADGQDWRVM